MQPSVYSDESLNRMIELNCIIYGVIGIRLDIQPSKILTPTKADELQRKISLEYDRNAKLLRDEQGLNRISEEFENIAKYFLSHEKVARPYLEAFYLLSIILFPK